jgi:hypothetical protein
MADVTGGANIKTDWRLTSEPVDVCPKLVPKKNEYLKMDFAATA